MHIVYYMSGSSVSRVKIIASSKLVTSQLAPAIDVRHQIFITQLHVSCDYDYNYCVYKNAIANVRSSIFGL